MKTDDTTVTILLHILSASVTILCCLAHKYYQLIKNIEESDERFHSRLAKLENHLGVNTIKYSDLTETKYRFVSPWKYND